MSRPAERSERERLYEHVAMGLDLCDFGDQMMRQNIRRRFPEADEAEIELRFLLWLRRRPWDRDALEAGSASLP